MAKTPGGSRKRRALKKAAAKKKTPAQKKKILGKKKRKKTLKPPGRRLGHKTLTPFRKTPEPERPQPERPQPEQFTGVGNPPQISGGPVAVYQGAFGAVQAERLLWRAGFGPRPGEAEALAAKGLQEAVYSFSRPQGDPVLDGPIPKDQNGYDLAPADASNHDHLWWLDRMVRSSHQLQERMTLIWHDWFATSMEGVGRQRKMLDQNELFRRNSLGSFEQMLLGITTDAAMLLWLNGLSNRKGRPNENYARELMELFTLGADSGAYGEEDVKELARALTGMRLDYNSAKDDYTDFRFDPTIFDGGPKRVLGRYDKFDWKDACRLCLYHPAHSKFFVTKLWSYFIPTAPDATTCHNLEAIYVNGGYQIRPVVEAILMHPDFYEGPSMPKPPVVHNAGVLRALKMGINTNAWAYLSDQAGQRLFYPPNVSGWDDTRWLDTSTLRGRWQLIYQLLGPLRIGTSGYDTSETAATAVARAMDFLAQPRLTPETRQVLLDFASTCLPATMTTSQQSSYRAYRQNALRHLILISPDYQVC